MDCVEKSHKQAFQTDAQIKGKITRIENCNCKLTGGKVNYGEHK